MVKAIVGANWGDEGKGKITDLLAETSDVVIRFQGGANAGHTIINDYGRFALHILPSGTFYPHVTNIIGNGVALDAAKLVKELKDITDQGVPQPNLIVSERCQLLLPTISSRTPMRRSGWRATPLAPPSRALPPSIQTNMPRSACRYATSLTNPACAKSCPTPWT